MLLISLNVSESDKGFIQKSFLRSFGQSFRGKKASPLMALKSSRLFSTISCLLSQRSFSFTKRSEDIVKMRQRKGGLLLYAPVSICCYDYLKHCILFADLLE